VLVDYPSDVVFPEDVGVHKHKLAKSGESGNVDVDRCVGSNTATPRE
jgi:hypothetical protein